MTSIKYDLKKPVCITNPVIFSSPHSGRYYPVDFVLNSILKETHLRSSEDAYVDELFANVVEFGSPLLAASVPRAYVDLNRSADEFDPSIIEDVRAPYNNPRIASGLGVIPRVVSEGRQIQRGKMTLTEAKQRIRKFYTPYHNALSKLLAEAKSGFGKAVLIDCHSMPSDALQNAMAPGGLRPDIILGNRFGASASKEIFNLVEEAFKLQGFLVGRNAPFAGGYITQKYGTPSQDQHVVQVEINRALYMDENKIVKTENFENLKMHLQSAAEQICNDVLPSVKMAAE